jgi:glucose uptake protein GlcU
LKNTKKPAPGGLFGVWVIQYEYMTRNIIIGAALIILVIVVGISLATKVTKDALVADNSTTNQEP